MNPAALVQRATSTRVLLLLIPIFALFGGLAVGALFLLIAGVDPVDGFDSLIENSVGNKFAIANTISQATPIMFTGLAVTICFRAGVYNVGQEGSLYIGALAGIPLAIYLDLPGPLLIAVAFIASAAGGALWSLIPAIAKVRRGTNEIMSTLLLNFIAIYLVGYFVAREYGPLWNDEQQNAASKFVKEDAHLTSLIDGANANPAILLAVAIGLVLIFLLNRTTPGFQIRALGFNPAAARYAGHSADSTVIWTMLASGAVAGLAGTAAILSQNFLLSAELSPPPGWGYIGIAAALLGGLRPGFVILAALFLGALTAGGQGLQLNTGAPSALSDVIQATTIICVMAGSALGLVIKRRLEISRALKAPSERPATPETVER